MKGVVRIAFFEPLSFYVQVPEVGYWLSFSSGVGLVRTFLTFGMLTVVCVSRTNCLLSRGIAPALLDPFLTGKGIKLVDDLFAKLAISRKGGVVFLNSGV